MSAPVRRPRERASDGSGQVPIENREMAAGTVLVARYETADRICEVVETADGLRAGGALARRVGATAAARGT